MGLQKKKKCFQQSLYIVQFGIKHRRSKCPAIDIFELDPPNDAKISSGSSFQGGVNMIFPSGKLQAGYVGEPHWNMF